MTQTCLCLHGHGVKHLLVVFKKNLPGSRARAPACVKPVTRVQLFTVIPVQLPDTLPSHVHHAGGVYAVGGLLVFGLVQKVGEVEGTKEKVFTGSNQQA